MHDSETSLEADGKDASEEASDMALDGQAWGHVHDFSTDGPGQYRQSSALKCGKLVQLFRFFFHQHQWAIDNFSTTSQTRWACISRFASCECGKCLGCLVRAFDKLSSWWLG